MKIDEISALRTSVSPTSVPIIESYKGTDLEKKLKQAFTTLDYQITLCNKEIKKTNSSSAVIHNIFVMGHLSDALQTAMSVSDWVATNKDTPDDTAGHFSQKFTMIMDKFYKVCNELADLSGSLPNAMSEAFQMTGYPKPSSLVSGLASVLTGNDWSFTSKNPKYTGASTLTRLWNSFDKDYSFAVVSNDIKNAVDFFILDGSGKELATYSLPVKNISTAFSGSNGSEVMVNPKALKKIVLYLFMNFDYKKNKFVFDSSFRI